ncbi:hypothetical protein [Paraburkholderia humisilvae]|uniref:hypothetical protein n=1 Tax=Paraburkholderia humisilvae TaxID=627669 RepID=UPI001583693B|nr:hypothetical protein [Paraburkholderia humisilvae]
MEPTRWNTLELIAGSETDIAGVVTLQAEAVIVLELAGRTTVKSDVPALLIKNTEAWLGNPPPPLGFNDNGPEDTRPVATRLTVTYNWD